MEMWIYFPPLTHEKNYFILGRERENCFMRISETLWGRPGLESSLLLLSCCLGRDLFIRQMTMRVSVTVTWSPTMCRHTVLSTVPLTSHQTTGQTCEVGAIVTCVLQTLETEARRRRDPRFDPRPSDSIYDPMQPLRYKSLFTGL